MNKGNIIRSIFWGTISFICLILGLTGVFYNNKINSLYEDDLIEIVKIFNSNDLIKEYRKIDNMIIAKVKGTKIKITSESTVILEYTYRLKKGNLVTIYDKEDSLSNNITMILADSIAVYNGYPSGSIYSLFSSNKIYNYKITDGIEFNDKSKEVSLSLSNPIVNYNPEIDQNDSSNIPDDMQDQINNENQVN